MKLRKMAAGILAAAMAVVSLPQAVSALGSDIELDPGSSFYVEFDPDTGNVIGEPFRFYDDVEECMAAYLCIINDDGTLAVRTDGKGIDSSEDPLSPYRLAGKKITIPDTICGLTVTKLNQCIGGFASITIPDTVTELEQTFSGQLLLEEVNFGAASQLKTIGKAAFSNCRSLKSLTIPANVETIGEHAFSGGRDKYDLTSIGFGDFTDVYSLETIEFAEGSKLKTIGRLTFYYNEGLKSIELPVGAEMIDQEAFMHCTALESVKLPQNIKELYRDTFYNCKSLKSITIPASVEKINDNVFWGCDALESITFEPDSKLNDLSKEAFSINNCLKSITLPASLERIVTGTFSKFRALEEINVDENNQKHKSINGVVFSKDGKTLEIFPVSKKADTVLSNRNGGEIQAYTVPDGVTDISSVYDNFNLAKLSAFVIPESVSYISSDAFSSWQIIIGVPGSYAETYANNNNMYFWDISNFDISTAYPAEPNTFTDEETGIKAIDKNNVLPENAEMSAKERMIASEEASYIVFFLDGNDEIYETAEEVEMWIPVPEVMLKSIPNLNRLDVFVTLNRRPIKLDHEYKDGYVVFDTSVFGEFRIVDRDAGIMDNPYPGPGTNTGTVNDEETGISVSGAVPEGAELKVTADTENSTDTRLFYDISLTKDGEEVQPNGTVTVKIPVPEKLKDNAAELKVYHLVDGKYTDMNARLENGYLVFTTDHFSVYVITSDTITDDDNNNNDDDNKGDDTTASEPAPTVPAAPSGSFYVPETTTAAATATEAVTAAPADTEAAETTAENTTTTAAAVTAAPADTNSNSGGDTTQPAVSENNGSDNSTTDNGASNVGNDGAANDKDGNPETGTAIAIVPVIVAAAAVSFFAYKRKK